MRQEIPQAAAEEERWKASALPSPLLKVPEFGDLRTPRTPRPLGAGKMLSCRFQCALALLSITLAVSSVSAAPSDPRLRQFLQKSLAAAAGKQELAKYFLAELLAEPSQTENEALEPEDLSNDPEQDEMRMELQRSANSNPAMAPRERKAGCKNFFWKTFTSC
ncbi:somatostatin [Dromiciops gliroides]|uniref:somatostatin n=1 Tax=Dromiciops gliroides TaxID=33562 RepID=UPI001CC426CD|nr:somatostatin [Dromiciops gliroides]